MKNKSAGNLRTSSDQPKAIAIGFICLVLLAGVVVWAFRATDHSGELRNVLASRDHQRLQQLLKDHPKLVEAKLPNRSSKDTWQALHMAAYHGDAGAVEILTRHKAKINVRDSNELTPLHYSVSAGRTECTQMLINKGADMNAKGRDGRTPLDLAKNLRDKRMIELFRIRGARE